MSTAKQIRVLLLLLLLTPLVFLAFWEYDPAPDWKRTLIVGLYPHNADGSEAVESWLAAMEPEHYLAIEDWLAEQASRYELAIARPFEFRIGQPIAEAPSPPPANGTFRQRIQWAISLRWWYWTFDRQGLKPDVVLVAGYVASGGTAVDLHSIGMARPRLGLARLLALDDREQASFNNVILAHELLHTVGASDLYHLGTGHPLFPQGYAELDREPRYPQQKAELMAVGIPLAEDKTRPAATLQEATIGTYTAREIGWR